MVKSTAEIITLEKNYESPPPSIDVDEPIVSPVEQYSKIKTRGSELRSQLN